MLANSVFVSLLVVNYYGVWSVDIQRTDY